MSGAVLPQMRGLDHDLLANAAGSAEVFAVASGCSTSVGLPEDRPCCR